LRRIQPLIILYIICIFAIIAGCGYANERYDGDDLDGDDDDDAVDMPSDDDDDDDDGAPSGTKVKEFTWTTVDGEDLNLYDYEGSVIILNVGAGWCEGCKDETPILEARFWQKYKDDGLVVIQLLTEDAGGSPADQDFANGWKDEYGITFPLCMDPDWALEEYFTESTLPFTMLIDRSLFILERFHGFNEEILDALVNQVL
jgi:peroxiredoxin